MSLASILGKESSLEIDSSLILPKLISQHGILSRRGHRTYAFSHLTFQEYYTAKHIVENNNKNTLKYLIDKYITEYALLHTYTLFQAILKGSRWHEVFLLTASLLLDATPLFQAMQEKSQYILENNPKLLSTQKWAIKRSNKNTNIPKNAKRLLYWKLLSSIDIDFGRTSTHYRDIERSTARSVARYFTSEIIFTGTNTAYYNDLIGILNLDTYLDIDCSLNTMVGNVPLSDITPDFVQNLNTAYDCVFNTKCVPPYSSETSEKVFNDFRTIHLLLLVKFFIRLPDKKSLRKLIKIINMLTPKWEETQSKQISLDKVFPPLSYQDQASSQEWESFANSIRFKAEELLKTNLNPDWKADDYKIATLYLQINRLFWHCLQVANVENRKAIEDMILNVPEGWEAPEENGANL